MRPVTKLCLAALAALATVGLVGVSSASAGSTSLCSVDESPCASGNRITHLHGVDPAALLLNDVTEYVECIALSLGDVLAAQSGLGSPLHVLGTTTFSSCEDAAGRECTATELGGPGLGAILRTEAESANITGESEILLRCGFFLHCVYNGEGLQGTVEGALRAGGNGVTKTHNAVTNNTSGFLCPETSEMDVLGEGLTAKYVST